ncbi:NUDIX hydrolase [Halosimplex marinum]|uniref:NUDIX hydrolase n=1 Tax=Halosimplex marinum TaxID=3396620 RepID=UPI003F558F0B
MSWRDIRPLAVGVPRRPGEVLLSRLYDDGEPFYRPIGGAIEFGESSDEALAREFDEELGVEVVEAELLETLENSFTFDGQRGHEIWFLYEVALAESWPYERDEFEGEEPEIGETYEAVWKPVDALDDVTVYPEHLAALL